MQNSQVNLKTSLEQMLLEFQLKYGHLISEKATLDIPIEAKLLRYKLIEEETTETFKAMGFYKNEMGSLGFTPETQDLVEIADGIADSVYVLVGTAISYGIPFDRIFTEVHRSNMTKTPIKAESNQKYGTKTPKGPDFIPPDIQGILTHPERKTRLELLYLCNHASSHQDAVIGRICDNCGKIL